MKFQDYRQDARGKACLKLSGNSKAKMRFGAILVKGRKTIGRGWNRRATDRDRALLSHVDYAIHAEQAAIVDAIENGHDPQGGKIYVLGEVACGPNCGHLSARRKHFFGCLKCPHAFQRFEIVVHIPTTTGWVGLTGEQALKTARNHRGHWKRLVSKTSF